MTNSVKQLCLAPSGQPEILQGNIAFAIGCVRTGIHSADGYPGTPSSEVIDRGLSQVQDMINVNWSVNEAVASAVGHGHSMAGRDCVVTMKIPGLFQAADIFTSGSLFVQARGALIYYIASDFTSSSTQHLIDPHYLFKSCFTPVFEPRSHQELHEAAAIAVEIARTFKTQVVIMPNGNLCHSEGLVHLMPPQAREPVKMPHDLRSFNVLPAMTHEHYDTVMTKRMPALTEMVEKSPLNHWQKGAGKMGVITYGACDMYVREVKETIAKDFDILSLAFTNPLPIALIREFCSSIAGEVFVIEDGYRFLQESLDQAGLQVSGKEPYSTITEWTPAMIAERLGYNVTPTPPQGSALPVVRPPIICAGCPYRLFAQEVAALRRKGLLDAAFGDIGCNSLLYYMNALDTALAMGASEGQRIGYVFSLPEKASRCISVVGDSTECHSGMDATRNAVYRNAPGVKVILDNSWTGMTGGQPSPTSPTNFAGEAMHFDLAGTLKAHGAQVVEVGAYDRAGIRNALKTALSDAEKGRYTTVILHEGSCIQKVPPSSQRVYVDPAVCKKCGLCQICPGLSVSADKVPFINNLCVGCGGQVPACVQMCPTHVLKTVDLKDLNPSTTVELPAPPREIAMPEGLTKVDLPLRISLAIRGVGGQGNLFFGHVLSQLALLTGYGDQNAPTYNNGGKNIIKGDTHGMSQMGGPVISTFGCGNVSSPVLLPGTVDCLIVMEKSEALRPGFLTMLKPGGTILLASTKIVPFGLPESQYPTDAQINKSLSAYQVIEVDAQGKAMELGDASGRSANVLMLGMLSTLEPFNVFAPELWLKALQKANSKPMIWAINDLAFNAGREYALSLKA